MALEAAVFPRDLISHCSREPYPMALGQWRPYELGELEEEKELVAWESEVGGVSAGSCNGADDKAREHKGGSFDELQGVWDLPSSSSSSSMLLQSFTGCHMHTASPETCVQDYGTALSPSCCPAATRRKRRRTKSCRNKEEVENQRMTHIAVERKRRKQMNEYLALLRCLMPASYVPRGDQASIVGGAINFVKELEQLLQSLEAHKRMKQQWKRQFPLKGFFTTDPSCPSTAGGISTSLPPPSSSSGEEDRTAVADVDVTVVESHANVKVLSRRRPQQLPRMVVGLQGLRLTTLHLNVTTMDQMVFYSFSLKVEEDCQLSSGEGIAAAVRQILGRIREETGF